MGKECHYFFDGILISFAPYPLRHLEEIWFMNICSILLLESSWAAPQCLVINISLWAAKVLSLFSVHRYWLPQIYMYTYVCVYIYTFYLLSPVLWSSHLRFRKGNFGIMLFPQISPIPLTETRMGLALDNAAMGSCPGWGSAACSSYWVILQSATVLLHDREQFR